MPAILTSLVNWIFCHITNEINGRLERGGGREGGGGREREGEGGRGREGGREGERMEEKTIKVIRTIHKQTCTCSSWLTEAC